MCVVQLEQPNIPALLQSYIRCFCSFSYHWDQTVTNYNIVAGMFGRACLYLIRRLFRVANHFYVIHMLAFYAPSFNDKTTERTRYEATIFFIITDFTLTMFMIKLVNRVHVYLLFWLASSCLQNSTIPCYPYPSNFFDLFTILEPEKKGNLHINTGTALLLKTI